MAGQVWLVVAICSIVGVVPCLAAAEAQMVYNADGSTRLEIINVPGQPQQGRMSWQTPDLSQVWIQYPVNQHGRVPWTPAQFTYSVVSDPVKRRVPVVPIVQPVHSNPQIFSFDERIITPNNQEQSSRSDKRFESRVPAEVQSLPNEIEYDYDYDYIEEATSENQPFAESSDGEITGPGTLMDKFPGPEMDKFPGPVMDKFPGPVMDKFPGPVMDKFPGPEVEEFPDTTYETIDGLVLPEMDKFPGPVMDKFPGPLMDKFPGPVMDKFPGPVMDKFPGPVMDKFPGPVMDKFPGPVMDKFPGPVMDKFPGPEVEEFPDTTYETLTVTTTESPNQTTSVRNRFTLPFTTTSSSVHFTEARVTPSPTRFRATTRTRPMMNKFPGPVESRVTPFPRRFRPTSQRTVMNKFPGPMMNTFPGPEESRLTPAPERPIMNKFPGPIMNKFPGPVESRVTPIPRRSIPTSQRSVMNKFPGPMMNKFPGPEESRLTPATERPIMNKFPGPMMNKFPGPTESPVEVFSGQSLVDEEIISVTEPVFENSVINELDSTNIVETDEQIEDTTELGPVIRLTSRGRPQILNKPAQKIRSETTKQSSTQKPNQSTRQIQNRRPVPQLLVDPSLRQSNRVQSTTRVNTQNPLRFRRPGTINQQRRPESNQVDQSQLITDPSLEQSNTAQQSTRVNNENRIRPGVRRTRPGGRLRPGIRRRPVSDNVITLPSTDISLPRVEATRSLSIDDTDRDDLGRGAARSPPRRFRFRNERPSAQ